MDEKMSEVVNGELLNENPRQNPVLCTDKNKVAKLSLWERVKEELKIEGINLYSDEETRVGGSGECSAGARNCINCKTGQELVNPLQLYDDDDEEEIQPQRKRVRIIEESISNISDYVKLKRELLEKRIRKKPDLVEATMRSSYDMLRCLSKKRFFDFYCKYIALLNEELQEHRNSEGDKSVVEVKKSEVDRENN